MLENKTSQIHQLLDRAWQAYDEGKPFMSDADFDQLSIKYKYDSFGAETVEKKGTHLYPMHSLKKVYDEEKAPYPIENPIESPKLDGTAISLCYAEGYLVQGLRRGRDGLEGEIVTDKMSHLVPNRVDRLDAHQISGEVVCDKEIENARNFASGAFGIKDITEFVQDKLPHLTFVAYDVKPSTSETYSRDMTLLEVQGFWSVIVPNIQENFRTDGTVYRENNNQRFEEAGYTSKHPKGSYARKQSNQVASEIANLRRVIWQVGRTGKVTPVAIFTEIIIDDAKITRATLHNAGFIEEMQLDIGNDIVITRAGGVIPKVVGKV